MKIKKDCSVKKIQSGSAPNNIRPFHIGSEGIIQIRVTSCREFLNDDPEPHPRDAYFAYPLLP